MIPPNDRKLRRRIREDLAMQAITIWGDPAHLPWVYPPDPLIREFSKNVRDKYPGPETNIAGVGTFLYCWLKGNLPTIRVPIEIVRLADTQSLSAMTELVEGTYRYPYTAVLIEPIPPDTEHFVRIQGEDYHFTTHIGAMWIDESISENDGPGIMFIHVGLDTVSLSKGYPFVAGTHPQDPFVIQPETARKALAAKRLFDMDGTLALVVPYLLSSGLYKRSRQGTPRSDKKRKKKGQQAVPVVWNLDIPAQVMTQLREEQEVEPRGPVGDRASPAQHIVSGHWRDQAHGPHHGLRRRTWIRPHWRGLESLERVSKTKTLEGK